VNEEFVNRELSADADDRLSQLLAEWGQQVRLSQQEENELYDRIFVLADDLGYDWWRQLIGGFPFQTLNSFPAFRF